MTECHSCSESAELALWLPVWDEARPMCRRCLRLVIPEADARAFVDAGYAVWLGGVDRSGDLPHTPAMWRGYQARRLINKELDRRIQRRVQT